MKALHEKAGCLNLSAGAMIVAMIFCWIPNGTAVGAPSSAARQAGEMKPAAPAATAIADSEIIPRAEQTIKSLQKLKSAVAADPTLSKIQKEFAAFAEKSERRRESEVEVITKSRSVQRLNEIQRERNLEESQLDEWEQELARRSRTLAAQQRDVDRVIETWRATQLAVAKKFLFKAVLESRVEEVLREAQATALAIQAETTTLLKLQGELADRLTTLAEIQKEIDQAREESGRRLFSFNSPPLWEALSRPETPETVLAEAAGSAQERLRQFSEFVQMYSVRIPLQALLFLALVALFYFLRAGLTHETAQRLGAGSSMVVFDRPLSSSLLLTLLASPFFYPGAAAGILRTSTVPTVISVIRLHPALQPVISRRWFYFLAALYVLDYFRYLLPEGWLLTRLLLLLMAVGGCVGLGLFLHSSDVRLSDSSPGERLVLLLARFVLVLFTVSLLANLVGIMTLAEFLVTVPIRIAYFGALISAGAQLSTMLTVAALQSRLVRWFRSVREHGALLAARCRIVIRIAAVIFWAGISLHLLGVLGNLGAASAAFLQLHWKIGATEISVEGVALFFTVVLSAILASRLLRFILTEEVFPRIALPRGVPGAVDVLVRYVVLLLGFLIALAAAGVDFSKVTLVISALGVGIGFGLQNLVNNFVSGLILVFEHPVQVGDTVEVGSHFGEVRKIGFRASVLRTPDGADVIVPNSELIGSRVVNWSFSDRLRRISISVTVAYGTDPERVMDLLRKIARDHSGVLTQPEPLAVFERFGDSALTFTLFCWAFIDNFFVARSELTVAVNNAFKEAGIEIPFPQQDVHLHWSDTQETQAGSAELPPDAAQRRSAEMTVLLAAKGPVQKR
jgi:small-conductance mechanosensitive channel